MLASISTVALTGVMLLITTTTPVFGSATKRKPVLNGKEGGTNNGHINSSFGAETISGLSR